MNIRDRIRRWKIGFIVLLVVICVAGLLHVYLNRTSRGLASVSLAWQQGEQIEAIRRYEKIVRDHPETSRDSLAAMYATLYKESKATDPQLAHESKAHAVLIIEGMIAQSTN